MEINYRILSLDGRKFKKFITEVQAVINSRPLVYVDDDLENQVIIKYKKWNPRAYKE